jgi:hypothetical protein
MARIFSIRQNYRGDTSSKKVNESVDVEDRNSIQESYARLEKLAGEIYAALAAQFPVCLSSDEFHFFPHFRPETGDQSAWDDFSEGAVRNFFSTVMQWQTRLDALKPQLPASAITVDIDLLSRVLTTLYEQLKRVRVHQTQPAFYLTIISIGLAEAMSQSREALERRIISLPAFLEGAMTNLTHVPVVAAEVARKMIPGLMAWVSILPLTNAERDAGMAIFQRFHTHLDRVDTVPDFRLPGDLYARVADFHMGCRMGLEEVDRHLNQEIEAAENRLSASAAKISGGQTWQEVFQALPSPAAPRGDVQALYSHGIARLKNHCLEQGFFSAHQTAGSEVEIKAIAEHMMPVRANAAYSMPPGHPPSGGVFYMLPLNRQPVPRDMMLLAAHETYPGHHLLDTLRWNQRRPLRRCLEFPLFYEGWASFCEEILFDSKFFSGPADSLMMAKRRFWRAMRGRAELRIHTGRYTLDEAAQELAGVGLVTKEHAEAMVRRYALKPGYQLAYPIGRRKFRRLYTAFLRQGHSPAHFVRNVLAHGEIGFDHLAERLLCKASDV